MAEIIRQALPIQRRELDREEAMRLFAERGEPYKVELLDELDSARVSLYEQGTWVDLCRGPHLSTTGDLKAFKLTGTAGAYWKGDEKNKMLQRVYGTAFYTKDELKAHLDRIEEAKRRDHRKLGRELDLFSTSENIGSGLVLWHPKGAAIRGIIENFWKAEHAKAAGAEVTKNAVPELGWSTLAIADGRVSDAERYAAEAIELLDANAVRNGIVLTAMQPGPLLPNLQALFDGLMSGAITLPIEKIPISWGVSRRAMSNEDMNWISSVPLRR